MRYFFAMRKIRFPRKFRLPHVLMLFFSCLPLAALGTSVPSQKSAREQINAQTFVKVSKSLNSLAKQQQWQDYHYKINLFIPPLVATLAHCSEQLKVVAPPINMKTLNHLKVSVRCESAARPWRILVTVKPDIYVPVVMPKKEIERGESLNIDELILRKFNIRNQRGALFYRIEDAVGLIAKRTLMAYKPISSTQLQIPVLVKRDQPVTIISHSGGISAQTAGVALENGHKGDAIKVRNGNSQRIVTASVEGGGLVKVSSFQ